YVIAVGISEKLWLMSQAASTVLLPRLSQLSDEESKRKALTPLIARWVLLSTLLVALILATLAPWLIIWIFGLDYSGALLPLWILLPGIVFGAASRVLANDIAARGLPEWNLYTSLFVVTVNLIGNILLIPGYGLAGAAASTTIAYSLNFILRIFIYGKISENIWIDSIFIKLSDLEKISIIFRQTIRIDSKQF
ncbi:MAG: polysaccharide biosynthesis C-terminal domain-containing protein, partial [Deltaproteobacteria bacterium]